MTVPNKRPDQQAVDAEHPEVLDREQRAKADENADAEALLEENDLDEPVVGP